MRGEERRAKKGRRRRRRIGGSVKSEGVTERARSFFVTAVAFKWSVIVSRVPEGDKSSPCGANSYLSCTLVEEKERREEEKNHFTVGDEIIKREREREGENVCNERDFL